MGRIFDILSYPIRYIYSLNTPTSGATDYKSDGTWNNDGIYPGQLAIQTPQGRMFTCTTGGTVVEFARTTDILPFTGGTAISLSATTFSAGTIYSGSTNLYDIFLTTADGNDITRVTNGTNTYTGGTANLPSVNISSATLNTLSVSGTSSLATLSATTIFSGSTNIGNIFELKGAGDITRVQPGTNISTGGTANLPTVNLVDSPNILDLTIRNLTGATERVVTVSADTLTAPYELLEVEFIQADLTFLALTGGTISGNLDVTGSISGDTITTPIYLTYDGASGTPTGTLGATLTSPGNWTVTNFNAHYYCDDTGGNLTITIPDADATNEGKTIQFSKPRLVTSSNMITLQTVSGQKIAQNATFVMHASDERFEFVSCNFGAGGAAEWKYRVTLGTDQEPHVLRVSPYSTLFTTVKSAVDYANSYVTEPACILVEPGEYPITSPITVTKDKLKISGRGVGVTTLYTTSAMSGQSIFTCTQNFELDNMILSANTADGVYSAIQFSGTPYSEIKSVEICGFQRGICFSQEGSEIWLFDSIVCDNTLAGVCNLGGSSIGVSECTFENNNYGINFFTGNTQRHSVQNTIFIVYTGQTGVQWNTTGNTYEYAAFTNNIFKASGGTSVGGFTWDSKADADIRFETNTGVKNYSPTAFLNFTGTSTTLTTANTYYKLLGGNKEDVEIKFLCSANTATYLPSIDRNLHIVVTGGIECDAANQTLMVALYKNGTIKLTETEVRCVTANIQYPFSLNYLLDVYEDDFFEIWATNTTSNDDSVICNYTMTIKV